jgi:signal transduction histidine kinase
VKDAIKRTDRQPVATIPAGRPAGLVTYFIGAAAISVVVAVLAAKVSPVLVGAVLATYLTAAAYFLFDTRRRLFTYDRWRDVMPCHLSVQDASLRIIDTNDLFRRNFGDREGEYCYKVYKGEDAPCPECPVIQTFEDGKLHTSEETVVNKDGKMEQVVVTSAPLMDDQGRVNAVVEMSTTVTEIKTLQDKLERTHRDYKRLFDHVPCYISVINRDLKVVQSNSLYRHDFGSGDGDGDFCFELCKHRNTPCPDCLVKETFEDGKLHTKEETLTTRDRRKVDVVVYTMPVKNSRGEISAVVEMFTDITEVKRLHKQLTLMGRAVAGMAHRIKNILMGLEGGIFVVNTGMEEDDKAQIVEGWEMVERNVKRVSNVVMDLLYCSKERVPQFKDDVNLQEVLEEVHQLYRKKTMDEDIEMRLETSETPIIGRFDPDGIHSLLCNLVSNAIDGCRFDLDDTKEDHTITMRCELDDEGATVIEVEDDGGGIPEEFSQKVFEDFFSTKGTEGTGVGLLVVQKVAQEHGGNVNFSSAPGKGTKFRITIPPVASS